MRLTQRLLLVCALFTLFCSASQAAPKANLLVMGDSLGAAHNLRQQDGWVSLLKNSLSQSHPNINTINASVGGETTQGGASRFPTLLKEYQPRWVILELGANDALRGYPLDQTTKNLAKMIEQAQQEKATVLLIGNRIPQNYGKRYTEMFFGLYKTLADQYNLAYVPFMLEGVALDKSLMQSDGLHPNAKGQPIVLNNILPHLLPLLEK